MDGVEIFLLVVLKWQFISIFTFFVAFKFYFVVCFFLFLFLFFLYFIWFSVFFCSFSFSIFFIYFYFFLFYLFFAFCFIETLTNTVSVTFSVSTVAYKNFKSNHTSFFFASNRIGINIFICFQNLLHSCLIGCYRYIYCWKIWTTLVTHTCGCKCITFFQKKKNVAWLPPLFELFTLFDFASHFFTPNGF